MLFKQAEPLLKGFYTCLRAGDNRSHWLKGGFYPLVAFDEPHHGFPVNGNFRYLFSFVGSFETHAIRRQIGALPTSVDADKTRPFLISDTSTRSLPSKDEAVDDGRFRQNYLDTLRVSKFILCPRGRCPSSVRLFETMKAARVPVVISDEWVPPPEIAWKTFAIVVKEKDVPLIPQILGGEELSFIDRATAARKAWEDYFSVDALPGTVVRWGMALVEEARQPIHRRTHLTQLLAQTVQWRFIRRGVGSELRHLVARAHH